MKNYAQLGYGICKGKIPIADVTRVQREQIFRMYFAQLSHRLIEKYAKLY